ncbi:hypothetical protein HDU97_006077 [Phlyctochytrium planicorne]|nr:hypothetical protein HDU97_006077 [Phlyctochytrium planicorne]
MGVISNYQVVTYRCPVEPVEDSHGNVIETDFDPEPIVSRSDPVISVYLQTTGSALPELKGIEILRRRRDEFEYMYRTRHLGAFATASYMSTHPYANTWDKFMEFTKTRRKQITMLLLGGYLMPAEGQGSSTHPNDTRQFLAVAETIRPQKKNNTRKKTIPTISSTMRLNDKENAGVREPDLLLIGYVFLEWFILKRHVNVLHLLYVGKDTGNENGNIGPDSPLKVMIASGVARIMSDVENFNHPSPEHLWAKVPKVDVEEHAKYILQLEKLGFYPLADYCALFGFNQASLEQLFESLILQQDIDRLYTVFVCNWNKILW